MKLHSFLLMTLLVAAFNFTKQAGTAQVTLTSDPPWLEVFRGEPITLRCTIKKSEEHISWTYTWKKQEYNGQVQVLYADGGAPTFPLDHPVETGMIRYWCEANNGKMSINSNPLILKVIDKKPKPVITQNPPSAEVYTGQRLTLSCGFRGDPAGWQYQWFKDTQGAELPNTDSSRTDGSSYTISSAALTHSGEYRCIASRGPFYSHSSDSLTLKISDTKPKPVITQNPPGTELYTGERVTLSCRFEGDPAGWEYLWYKDTQGAALPNTDSSRTDGSSYTISSAALTHSGEYRCIVSNGRDYSDYSDSLKLKISALPQAELTVQSGGAEVFPTERVTLRCEIQGSSTEWMYRWYRDGQELPVDKADSSSGNGDTYTILSADQSHTGLYTCRGELTERGVQSTISSAVKLSVINKKPKPIITQDPPGAEMYTGERVTLSCGFGGDPAGWEYLWYKDTQGAALPNTDSSRTDGSGYTIRSAALTHSGEYWCIVSNGRDYSDHSDSLKLKISALPQAEVTVQSGWTEVFPTERVTLRCEIQGSSTEWMYRWCRDGQELPVDKADSSSGNGDTYTILSADQSHTGLYTCRGELTERGVQSTISRAVKLSVINKKPKPVITQDPPGAEVYTGERVTLSCGFGGDSAGWEYLWYKDTQGAALHNTDSSRTDGSSYTISSAALSHSGDYSCRAARGRGPFYSEYSDSIFLKISAPPRPQLSVQSGWTEVFPTERVTLRCEIQGSSTEWMYRWCRDGQELPVDKADSSSGNGDTYTILSADQSHTGLYTCRGELTERGVQSTISSAVKLNVTSEKPNPVITQDPPGAEVYTGERVTLSCGFGGDPAGWEYLWYKDTQGAALHNTDSSRTDGSSYTISSAALTHSGEYWCRAARGRDPFHSNYSDSVILSIIARPLAVVTMETGWTEIFTSGSVTVRCEVKGTSAEWNYTWYRDGEQIPLDHPGERLTVRIWNSSYWGQYECRGNRSEKPFYTTASESFKTTSIMLYCILGLSGSLFVFIAMIILAVKCIRKPEAGKKKDQLDQDDFYFRVNADYMSADCMLTAGALYEEIQDPVPKSQGSQSVSGQHSFFSAVQLKPLNQGDFM